MDFQKLHKFGKSISEKNTQRAKHFKKCFKTPRVRSEELIDWVNTSESDIGPEKEIVFQNKQIENSEFVMDQVILQVFTEKVMSQ